MTRESPASTIASSSLRLSPWASAPAGQTARSASPTRSSAQSARSSAGLKRAARRHSRSVPPRAASAASRTFSLHRQEREHARGLERASEARAGARERRLVRHVPTVELDPAGGRSHHAGEQVEQRRLPCSVRADDPDELAPADLERDIGDDVSAADVEPEAVGGENRGRFRHPSPALSIAGCPASTSSPAARCSSPAAGRAYWRSACLRSASAGRGTSAAASRDRRRGSPAGPSGP